MKQSQQKKLQAKREKMQSEGEVNSKYAKKKALQRKGHFAESSPFQTEQGATVEIIVDAKAIES